LIELIRVSKHTIHIRHTCRVPRRYIVIEAPCSCEQITHVRYARGVVIG